jgi:Mg2+ and Co2+ transporter CorA
LQQTEKKLNGSYLFGQQSQNYIDEQEEKMFKAQRTQVKDLPELEQFCWKMNRMAEIVELLMGKSEDHEQRIGADGKRYEKLVDDSFRRLEDKLNSHIDSFTKTINGYFTQTNQKVAEQ